MLHLLIAASFVAHATDGVVDTRSPHYVGCFTDSVERVMDGGSLVSQLNAPEFCMGVCFGKGYTLSGTQCKEECYCADALSEKATRQHDRECYSSCPGDPSLKCGGTWRLSVYRTTKPGGGYNPVNSSYLGCYEDDWTRFLKDERLDSSALTPDYCVNHCLRRGHTLAGLEAGRECFCGDSLYGGVRRPDGECATNCGGDELLKCGGKWRLSIYRTEAKGRGVNSVVSNYVGCYKDSEDRQLTGALNHSDFQTPDYCVDYCYNKGFSLAGVQMGRECFCGDTLREGTLADDSDCDVACPGDGSIRCGGRWRLSLYRTLALGRGFNAVQSNYLGCYRESRELQLNGAKQHSRVLKPDDCVKFCTQQGFRLAGLHGTICYCGDTLIENSRTHDEAECSSPCPGDLALKCGGDSRITVYSTNVDPDIVSQYIGCFEENSEDRLLGGVSVESSSLTVDFCIGFCYRRGYLFAGMQFGEGCFCGNSLKQRERAGNRECSVPCRGDKYQMCGGHWRVSVYTTSLKFTDLAAFHEGRSMGCYKDTGDRQLMGARMANNYDSLTPAVCTNFCYRKGFRLAGLQAAAECFCGDNLQQGSAVKNNECDMKCSGDQELHCGGIWRMNVFATSIPDLRANSYYVGCFDDLDNRGLLKDDTRENDFMTIEYCVGFCTRRNYIYAGIKNGATCYCGDTLSHRNDIPNIKCDTKCAGDTAQYCGGSGSVSVYNTGVYHPMPVSVANCEKSKTTVNGRETCKNQMIFKEEFDHEIVDKLKWSYSRFMPADPDNEFVVLCDTPENVYVKKGVLYIRPTVANVADLRNGQSRIRDCTRAAESVECYRQALYYFILPPINSARVDTGQSFSFRYGTVHLRASLPQGDWIVPELWLMPKENFYGAHYSSGKVRLAMARGNAELAAAGGGDIGNKRLEAGILMGNGERAKGKTLEWISKEGGWHEGFHNFTFTWTPDNFYFSVDGSEPRELLEDEGRPLSEVLGVQEAPPLWKKSSSNMAPFDREFYISIGLSVGGMRDFPDGSLSRGKVKPWQDFETKAMLNFWSEKDEWLPSWKGEESALQVDEIRVTAL